MTTSENNSVKFENSVQCHHAVQIQDITRIRWEKCIPQQIKL